MKEIDDQLNKSERIKFLSNVAPFSELNYSELEILADDFHSFYLYKGELLIEQGDLDDSCYVLRKGQLEVFQTNHRGEQVKINVIEPGCIVGEISFYTGERRSSSVHATDDCEILQLCKSSVLKLGSESALLHHLSDVIADRLQRSELRKVLFVSPSFHEMSDAAKRDVETELQLVICHSGHIVFREGELSADIYIIISGRLCITDSISEPHRVLCELEHGQTVGEIAMLTGRPRTATVRAIRDSLLAKLSPEAFTRLLQKHPVDMMKQFAGKPVTQLWQQTLGKAKNRTTFINLAIIPTDPKVQLTLFVQKLAASLSLLGPTLHLNQYLLDNYLSPQGIAQTPMEAANSINISRWLNHQELRYNYILYEADATYTEWTNRCLRQADRILLVGDDELSPQLGCVEAHIQENAGYAHLPKSLVLLHRTPPYTGTRQWLDIRDVESHYHVLLNDENDFASIARLLAGKGIGLVISGGGARGFAHMGGIRALREAGVPIDKIGGTSVGSIVGAMTALDWTYSDMIEKSLCFNYKLDYTFPLVSLTTGANFTKGLKMGLGLSLIEDLRIPFFCISTDLCSSTQKVHTKGPVWKYVRASASIPGFFPPIVEENCVLVDGAMINNMPIDVMKSSHDIGCVIAFDVIGTTQLQSGTPIDGTLSGWKVFIQRYIPFMKKTDNLPRLAQTLIQASLTKSEEANKMTKELADYYIQFPVQQFGLLKFNDIIKISDIGYHYVRDKIVEWRQNDLCEFPADKDKP